MNWVEVLGFVTGIACVYLNAKENIWGWPIAMISVIAYAMVFYQAKLYADMWLQFFFLAQAFYGLYSWLMPADNNNIALAISTMSFALNTLCVGLVGILAFVIYYILAEHTDSDVPMLDSITTAISIVAQFLLARKKIENWLYWLVANVIYIALYFSKELYLTAFLYLILNILALMGYMEWRNKLRTQKVI